MNGMRKVSNTDPRIRREHGVPLAGDADPLQGITAALKAVQDIPRLHAAIAELTAESRRMWKTLEKVSDKQSELESAASEIAALVAYKESHGKVHTMMDARHQDQVRSVSEKIAAVRAEISNVKKDVANRIASELSKLSARVQADAQKVFANVAALVASNKNVPGRDQKVDVEVNLEQKGWDFNIKRDSHGLLDKVVASPRR